MRARSYKRGIGMGENDINFIGKKKSSARGNGYDGVWKRLQKIRRLGSRRRIDGLE